MSITGLRGSRLLAPVATRIRRILLVSPEERGHQRWDAYDAWLIRPLREQSLIDVLRGRLGGSGSGVMSSNSNEDYGFDLQRYAGLKVLLAEDDPVSAMVVSAVLRKAGCTVRHVRISLRWRMPSFPARLQILSFLICICRAEIFPAFSRACAVHPSATS